MTTSTAVRPTAATTSGTVEKPANPATWTAATDSSSQHKAHATKTGHVTIEIGTGQLCLCGCNQTAESRFRPGHDATLKGKLTRAALHNAKIELRNGEQTVVVDPAAFAAKLDSAKYSWSAALKVSVERAKQAEADRAKRAAEAKAKREAAAKERGESTKISFADFAA